MGSESTEEEAIPQKVKERIETYKYIINSAYTLFDGKYSMHEIETMPYKELLIKIEQEQEINRENEEMRKQRMHEDERNLQYMKAYGPHVQI